MPQTKMTSTYGDSIKEFVLNAKKSSQYGKQMEPTAFHNRLDALVETLFIDTISLTLNVKNQNPTFNEEQLMERVKSLKDRVVIVNGNTQVHQVFKSDYTNIMNQNKAIHDELEMRAKQDWKDKLRFIYARFLSTVAIGAGALGMTLMGYYCFGFETALLKKIPEPTPVVIQSTSRPHTG